MRQLIKDAKMVTKDRTVICKRIKPSSHIYLKDCLKCKHNKGEIVEISPVNGIYPKQEAIACKFPTMIIITDIIAKEGGE